MTTIARHQVFQGFAFLFYGAAGFVAYAADEQRSGGIVTLLIFLLAVAVGVQRLVGGLRGNEGGAWSHSRARRWVLTVFAALALLIGVLGLVAVFVD